MVKLPPSTDANDPLLSAPLQAGLESLMVNLDEELQRYRQGGSNRRSSSRLKLRSRDQSSLRLPQFPNPTVTHPQTVASPAVKGSEGRGTPLRSAPASSGIGPSPGINPPTISGSPSESLAAYPAATEDYLESTEALLETDPTAYITDYGFSPSSSPSSLGRQLATPLSLGALLLLLLTSAGFGYLVTTPQAIAQLRNHPLVQRITQLIPGSTPTQPTPAADPGSPAADTHGEGLQGLGPDLSAQEFGKLDLNRLSNLPSGSPNPAVATPDLNQSLPEAVNNPRSAVSANQVSAEPIVPLPSPQLPTSAGSSPSTYRVVRSTPPSPGGRVGVPTPPRPSRAVASSAAHGQPPKPLSHPFPSRSILPPAPLSQAPRPLSQAGTAIPRYYVVANYTGNASLEAARQLIGEAYLRNFASGTKIQLGAFAQESAAQDFIQKLQGQGLTVQLYTAP
ncbi:MAG: hypothetical protein ACOYMP_04005 [Nodosilinea sp.]